MKWYLRIEPVPFRSIRDYGKRAVTGSDGVTGGGKMKRVCAPCDGRKPEFFLYFIEAVEHGLPLAGGDMERFVHLVRKECVFLHPAGKGGTSDKLVLYSVKLVCPDVRDRLVSLAYSSKLVFQSVIHVWTRPPESSIFAPDNTFRYENERYGPEQENGTAFPGRKAPFLTGRRRTRTPAIATSTSR